MTFIGPRRNVHGQGAGVFRMSDAMPTGEKPAEDAPPARPESLPRCRRTEIARLNDEIVNELKTVYDPEIPADITRSV